MPSWLRRGPGGPEGAGLAGWLRAEQEGLPAPRAWIWVQTARCPGRSGAPWRRRRTPSAGCRHHCACGWPPAGLSAHSLPPRRMVSLALPPRCALWSCEACPSRLLSGWLPSGHCAGTCLLALASGQQVGIFSLAQRCWVATHHWTCVPLCMTNWVSPVLKVPIQHGYMCQLPLKREEARCGWGPTWSRSLGP